MSPTTTEDDKAYMKLPSFSGEEEDFPFYKKKMISFLGQKGCVQLLSWTDPIPAVSWNPTALPPPPPSPGNAVPPAGYSADDLRKIQIRDQNTKAAAFLLQSMDVTTKSGKWAFNVVSSYMDTSDYPSGHFPNAWSHLCDHFEKKNPVEAIDCVQEYFEMKMDLEDDPKTFIMELGEKRKLVNKNVDASSQISDAAFMKHVLAKLPRHDDPNNMGPYQIKRESILDKMENNTNYDLKKLTEDLRTVYKILHDNSGEDQGKESKSGDVGLAAFNRQAKRKCGKCGKWGHTSRFCRGSNNNDSSSGPRNQGNRNGQRSRIICHHCKKPGHIRRNCFKWKAEKKSNGDTGEIAFIATENLPSLDDDSYSVCSSIVEKEDDYDVSDDFFDSFGTESDLENCEVLSTGSSEYETATEFDVEPGEDKACPSCRRYAPIVESED